MNLNAQGHAIILCSECGIYTEHEPFSDPECGFYPGWSCCACDEHTEQELAEHREFECESLISIVKRAEYEPGERE